MSRNSSSGSTGGLTFDGVLFLIFLVLKLTGLIDWSWWWVTAPIWIPLLVIVAILLVAAIVGLVGFIKGGKRK